jgi:hypothetical protein
MTDSIKIACDFLDIESLSASCQLVEEFRRQRLLHHWPEDVLQFETTLWHAWTTLCKYLDQFTARLNTPSIVASTPALDSAGSQTIVTNVNLANGFAPTKQELKREKRRLHRKARTEAERSHHKPGHDCRCPLCPRSGYFNKYGLLHHL